MAAGRPNGTTVPGTDALSDSDTPRDRLGALADLLDASGIAHRRVSAAGAHHEIAVIATEPDEFHALAGLAQRIRELGFRFVALDLSVGEDIAGEAVSGPDAGAPAEPGDP